MKTHAKTKSQLAKILDVARNTLAKYLILPGAPKPGAKGYDVAAVASFIAGTASASESTRVKTYEPLRRLKERELLAKCKRIEFALERDRGAWVKKTEVCRVMQSILAPVVNTLETKLVNEWPPLFTSRVTNDRQTLARLPFSGRKGIHAV